jgi:two-component system, response regulator PdtaR
VRSSPIGSDNAKALLNRAIRRGRGGTAGAHSARDAGVVLIVEDDVLLRLITASNLRKAGFEVVEVANAAEAVIVLNSMAVDVMLTDVNMRGTMNGLALAQWVHSHVLDTRIILTSDSVQSLGEAREYAHFLAKPYDGNQVERLLRKMLGT